MIGRPAASEMPKLIRPDASLAPMISAAVSRVVSRLESVSRSRSLAISLAMVTGTKLIAKRKWSAAKAMNDDRAKSPPSQAAGILPSW